MRVHVEQNVQYNIGFLPGAGAGGEGEREIYILLIFIIFLKILQVFSVRQKLTNVTLVHAEMEDCVMTT